MHWWLRSSGNIIAKWIVLGVHVYTFIWLIGDAQALRVYRTSIRTRNGDRVLDVQVGLRARAEIPISRIAEVTSGTWEKPGTDEGFAIVQGTANLRLSFELPIPLKTMFGRPKAIRSLLLQLDDPARSKRQLVHSQ